MTNIRTVAVALASALLFGLATLPAGSASSSNCGQLIAATDLGMRSAMERFDRAQSATAARACAVFLNTTGPTRPH